MPDEAPSGIPPLQKAQEWATRLISPDILVPLFIMPFFQLGSPRSSTSHPTCRELADPVDSLLEEEVRRDFHRHQQAA